MPAFRTSLNALPDAHFMVHPGPLNKSRLDYVEIPDVISDNVVLPAGKTLHDAVIETARSLGGSCGTASLMGGAFSTTRFTTGGPAREGKAANYTFIRELGATDILSGTVSFGFAEDAPHFVHCHARLKSSPNRTEEGGHFFAPDCIIAEPIAAQINVFLGARIVKRASSETLHAIFEIDDQAPPKISDEYGREFFIRVHPNEDLPSILEDFCAQHKIANALVSASLGSLNMPALSIRGDVLQISSVGAEVIAFQGDVMREVGQHRATIFANLVDENGTEFSGYLIKGHSPVCITAEIYLIEIMDKSIIDTMRDVRDASY